MVKITCLDDALSENFFELVAITTAKNKEKEKMKRQKNLKN